MPSGEGPNCIKLVVSNWSPCVHFSKYRWHKLYTNLIYVDITYIFWYHFIPTNFVAVAPHGPPRVAVGLRSSLLRRPGGGDHLHPGLDVAGPAPLGRGNWNFEGKGLVDLLGILILMDTIDILLYLYIFVYCIFNIILCDVILYYVIWVSWVILELWYGHMDIELKYVLYRQWFG